MNAPNTAPDVVMIMVDQLSAKWLECNDGICPTPNLDALAAEGVQFSRTFTSNPICCAARATIATGLSTRCHGVLQNGYELNPSVPTFMTELQKNGWRTGAFGKVHLISHFKTSHPDYKPYGFDVTKITEDIRASQWLDWVQETYPEHYEKALATIWSVEIPEFQSYGADGVNLAEKCAALRNSFDWTTEEFPENEPFMYTLPFPKEMSQTEWITRNAMDYIQETDKEQPLFAHISYVQPHSPHCPPGEYLYKVDAEKIPAPVGIEWVDDANAPVCFAKTEGATKTLPDNWLNMRRYYYADIAHLDENIGKIMDSLKERGKLDNTWIIFVADHGELLLDHGFTGKGERHYDSCIRVPCILKGPGLEGGTTCGSFVGLEDIFPTVLDICGIPEPERPLFRDAQDSKDFVDCPKEPKKLPTAFYPGKSLRKTALGQVTPDTHAYVESYNNIESFTPEHWARTIRTDKWRYTYYAAQGGAQLFDLECDPDEQHNLVGNPDYADICNQLKTQLLEEVILQDYPHTPNSLFMLGVH